MTARIIHLPTGEKVRRLSDADTEAFWHGTLDAKLARRRRWRIAALIVACAAIGGITGFSILSAPQQHYFVEGR